MNFQDPMFIIIVSSIVMAMPMIFLVYKAVKVGRSQASACIATGYVVGLMLLFVFGIIYLQMTVVPKLFGHMMLVPN